MAPRVDWHTYFMNIARQVSTRATCDRKQVGAVIVRDKTILSTGYNGSIRGMPHCDDVGHELKKIEGRDSCIRTLHAESNAIDFAGRDAERDSQQRNQRDERHEARAALRPEIAKPDK